MDTKEFLRSVLGSDGFYCAVGLRKKGPPVQKFYDSIEGLTATVQNLDELGIDAYYALATFDVAGERTQVNAKQLKSFYLDLDCGENKPYKTQLDAIKALREFCKNNNLPRPTIVNSGNGVHVYWILNSPVAGVTWVSTAEKLKALCEAQKLYADPVVTADSARILRVPSTNNYKGETPKPVAIINGVAPFVDLAAFVSSVEEALQNSTSTGLFKSSKQYVPQERDAILDILSGSYASNFAEILEKEIGVEDPKKHGCAQIRFAYENQTTLSEPMWRAALSIAAFCEDKADAIHLISNDHPDYSPEETETKASRIKGPYRCSTFDEYNPDVCPNCPHWGKIKSPIRLSGKVKEAEGEEIVLLPLADMPNAPPQQYTIPKYPAPYFRGSNGGVYKREVRNEDVYEIPVYHNDIYVVRRIRDPEVGECVVVRLHLPRDGVRDFTMPLTAVGSRDELRKHMATHGVAVIKVDALMDYINHWVNNLQLQSAADEARTQFGWTNDETLDSFVIGPHEYYKDRIETNSATSKTVDLFHSFKPRGTLDAWKETMKFFNQHGMDAHKFMVALSFGSPLMPFFSPINGVIFHMHSQDSGHGKTTAMLAGASAWGNPSEIVLIEKDTYASKMNRAEAYKNLVLYVDEMTNTLPKDLSDFGYNIPAGRQRNRLSGKGNIERYRGAPWKLLCGSTGNTSMLGRIGLYKAMPKAEAQRILEFTAQNVQFTSKAVTDQFSKDILNCYGHAGPEYMKYVLNNMEAVNQICMATQTKLDEAAGLTKQNRFWSALAAASISGILVAKKAGLLDWQVSTIVQFIINAMEAAKTNINTMGGDVESILNDYWAENYNNVLRIRSTDDARGKGVLGVEHLITPEATPRYQLVARYEYDIKKLYLLPKPLREWCEKQQINYSGLVEGLKNGRTKAYTYKMRLGTGTHINLPPASVWVVDCSEFLDDEVEEKIAATATVLQKQNTAG